MDNILPLPTSAMGDPAAMAPPDPALLEEKRKEAEKKASIFWSNEIKRSEDFRSRNRDPRWRRARKDFMNLWFYDKYGKRQENFIKNPNFYSHVTTLVANISSQLPRAIASSKQPGGEVDSYFIQGVMQYELRRNEFQKLDRQAVLDAAVYNIGIVKTGYNFYESFMLDADSLYWSRVSPFNYLYDVEATSQRSARWEGERFYKDAEEFIAWNDSRIKAGLPPLSNYEEALKLKTPVVANTEMSSLTSRHYDNIMEATDPTKTSLTAGIAYDDTVQPTDVDRIELTVVYDKVHRRVIHLVNRILIVLDEEMPEWLLKKRNKSPYSLMQFNRTPDFFMGECDHSVFESKFHEIDTISNRVLERTKRNVSKALVKAGVFSKASLEKLENAKMFQVVEVDGKFQGSLESAVAFLDGPPIGQDNWLMLDRLENSLPRDTGLQDFQKGGATGGRKTATEVQAVAQGAGVRAKARLNEHDEFLNDAIEGGHRIVQTMYPVDRWISEAGYYPMPQTDPLTGQQVYVQAQGGSELMTQHLAGFKMTQGMKDADLFVTVEAGSTSEYNNYVKQQAMLNFVSTVSSIPALTAQYNWKTLAQRLARLYDFNPEELMLQQPAPGAMPPQAGMPGQPAAPSATPSSPDQQQAPGNMSIAGQMNKMQNQIQNSNAATANMGGVNVAKV